MSGEDCSQFNVGKLHLELSLEQMEIEPLHLYTHYKNGSPCHELFKCSIEYHFTFLTRRNILKVATLTMAINTYRYNIVDYSEYVHRPLIASKLGKDPYLH